MKRAPLRLACYASGLVTAMVATAPPAYLGGDLEQLDEEFGPLAFQFLLILSPFVVFSSIGGVTQSRILALVLATGGFWAVFFVVASRSVGGFNFGMGFLGLVSPLLVAVAAHALDRLFGIAKIGPRAARLNR